MLELILALGGLAGTTATAVLLLLQLREQRYRHREELARMQAEVDQSRREIEARLDMLIGPRAKRGEEAREPSLPDALIRACAAGECILFTGTEFAAETRYPRWSDVLLEAAATTFDAREWADLGRVDPDRRTLIAELVMQRLPNDELYSLARRQYSQPVNFVPPVARLLREIPFSAAVTTNWDRLLDRVLGDRDPIVATLREGRPPVEALQSDRFVLIKLHGDLDRRDTVVFSPRDYRQLIESNPSMARFLTSLVLSNSFLFVGLSAADIETFFEGLRIGRDLGGPQHFAIAPYDFDTELRAPLLASQYGVTLITYSGEESGGLFRLMSRLRNAVAAHPAPLRSVVTVPPLERVTLTNIGPFVHVDLALTARWTMIVGHNGTGKTTLLRAIGLGLSGDDVDAGRAARALLRAGTDSGSIEIQLGGDRFVTELFREAADVRVRSRQITPLQIGRWAILAYPALRGVAEQELAGPTRLGSQAPTTSDVLPLVLNIVDNRIADVEQWLINLEVAKDDDRNDGTSIAARRAFFALVREMMPDLAVEFDHLDRETWTVFVRTRDGVVPLRHLSHGTNSLIAWLGGVLQRMQEVYPTSAEPQNEPALLLVDEIDAHMHPEWQQRLIEILHSFFPRLQVVATTHSPLIVGSLAEAATLHLVDRTADGARRIVVETYPSFQGWRADQILTSRAFDLDTTLDPETARRLDEYAGLLATPELGEEGTARLGELEELLEQRIPLSPESERDREALVLLHEWLHHRLADRPKAERDELMRRASLLIGDLTME